MSSAGWRRKRLIRPTEQLEEGRQSSMFDDHPASAERAQHIRDRMKADGIK
ncbi:hypothetical protein NLT72_002519 [Citrobacter farmeri]|uniref:hypothetical protein n=1 Tax=Citrobacter farmeri TaxID=67824 RepID=UPI003AB4DF81